MGNHGVPRSGGLEAAGRGDVLELDADVEALGRGRLKDGELPAAALQVNVGSVGGKHGIGAELGDLCPERIVGFAPHDFVTREERCQHFVRAGEELLRVHNQLRDGVGVAMPQPEIRLQPGNDLTELRQPLLGGQRAEVIGGLARLGLDVVEICLEGHGFLLVYSGRSWNWRPRRGGQTPAGPSAWLLARARLHWRQAGGKSPGPKTRTISVSPSPMMSRNRLAHSMTSSSDLTSMTAQPPISSFNSMDGPSVTVNLPPLRRSRLPVASSAPVATRTPAWTASSTNLPISSMSSGVGGGPGFFGSKLGSYDRNCMIVPPLAGSCGGVRQAPQGDGCAS